MGKNKKAKSFSEISIGDRAEFQVKISRQNHRAFSRLSGDKSPIHTSVSFSKKTIFKKRIGYAFMLTGYLSKLYGEYLPGGSSICIKQEAKFIKPFFVGDTIKISGCVTNKFESTRLVEIKSEFVRNGRERVMSGIGLVKLLY